MWCGAIGVSGSRGAPNAPGGATDTKCAQAGIDKIASALEAEQTRHAGSFFTRTLRHSALFASRI